MKPVRCIIFAVGLLLVISPAHACYSQTKKDAWIKLPSPHERHEFKVNGVQVDLRITVTPAVFDPWASSCGFEFLPEGGREVFQWDSETFMGHMKYDRSTGILSIEALRYD